MTEQITELKERLVVGSKRDGRNCYDPQAKRELIEASLQPGVSVAKLALTHGINANLLRKWIGKHQCQSMASGLRRPNQSLMTPEHTFRISAVASASPSSNPTSATPMPSVPPITHRLSP